MDVSGTIHRLGEAVDELLALGAADVSDADCERLVFALVRERRRLLAATAAVVTRWDASGRWRDDGSRSPSARLARQANCSLREARAELRHGRSLREMPSADAALRDGRIGGDHVDLLARAKRTEQQGQFGPCEGELVGYCTGFRFAESARLVRHWVNVVDPDAAERAARDLLAKSSLKVARTFRDTVHLEGSLDPVGGAMFVASLQPIVDELRLADRANGVERTAGARRAAALVEMATRAHARRGFERRPDPLVAVVVGAQTAETLCELSNGVTVAPGLVVPWLCRCSMQTFVYDDGGTPLLATRERTFTGRLRRAIQVRDRHCRHPAGCDVSMERCDVDHVVPAAAGGATAPDNGRLLCSAHNRLHDLHDLAPPGVHPPEVLSGTTGLTPVP